MSALGLIFLATMSSAFPSTIASSSPPDSNGCQGVGAIFADCDLFDTQPSPAPGPRPAPNPPHDAAPAAGGTGGERGGMRGDFCASRILLSPQPPASDPIWGGRDPENFEVYRCYFEGLSGPDGLPWIDAVRAIGSTDDPMAIPPEVIARTAFARLAPQPISVGMAPDIDNAGSMGLVGLPVWMWVEDPDADTYGPASINLAAGAVTVSLTAAVERVEWDMGDGTVVTCTSPGTPYDPSRGAQPSPDCGHVYTTTSAGQSGDAFTVTATSYWVASWSSNTGAAGTIDLQQTATEQVRIGESQVIVTRD